MNIRINKNFEEEYKEEIGRGFSLKEMAAILTAVPLMFTAGYLLYKYAGLELETAVYVAVPAAIPVLACGFYTYQEMSPFRFLKEFYYSFRTSLLTYEAGEWKRSEARVFSMNRKERTGIRYAGKKRGRRKKAWR